MKPLIKTFICSLSLLFLIIPVTHAGQTGKITGKVIDATNGENLVGVNIVIEGTTRGAATDLNGEFIILNLAPGTYVLNVFMIGYTKTRLSNVKVSIDLTTRVDIKLTPTVLDLGETVTVVAEKPLIQADLTATSSSVSAEEIEQMPVESFQDVLQLQAGVVRDSQGDLHVRGGRASEIAYYVDGVSVSDPFSGKLAVNVDQGAIQELKVISGTFNAEYGQVMSGIVEIVTKDPETRFSAGGTFYIGDYLSSHKDVFLNIDALDPLAVNDAQFYLTGPMPFLKNRLSYYFSLRRAYNEGWLYGQRRFNPVDSSNFQSPDAAYMEQTGDNRIVPLNESQRYFANAKLVLKLTSNVKLGYNFLGDLSDFRNYNHLFKYNPDGDVRSHQYGYTNILYLNHSLSPSTFYTVKLSRYYFNYKSYLYKDPDDPRYVNPQLLINQEDAYSFLTGGTNLDHYYRSTTVDIAKFDLTSQITNIHQVKIGAELKYNTLKLETFPANYKGQAGGGIFSANVFFNQGKYTHHPIEAVLYLQDKIELKNMTVNAGLRYDYFNSNYHVPKDLRDPNNSYLQRAEAFQDASSKHELSPRLGLAFPISVKGVVHGSYGHFFQIPPFEYLYMNPRFAVAPGGLNTLMGNADLKQQYTVIYEIGYQQQLLDQLGIDITGFYKDARNLLGSGIYETYVLGDRYARYEVRDYGNIKGITLAINKRPTATDNLTISFDYTFQVAEGNASDPNHEFYNNQADPPKKSNIQVVPLDWDQRYTINVAVGYHHPRILGIGLIGQLESGLPYTPAIQSLETTFENSGRKPLNYNVDLRIYRQFKMGKTDFNFFIKVYNLFDRKNEINVYADTGRSGYSLVSQYIGERRGYVNSLDEWLRRPDFYSEPRKMLIGFDVEF